jgi:hypothetical protein
VEHFLWIEERVMSISIDPLADVIRQFPIGSLIAVTILAVFCAWWVAFKRLKMHINVLRRDIGRLEEYIGRLEGQYGALLLHQVKLQKPRSGNARRSNPLSDRLQETSSSAPEQRDKKDSDRSAAYVVAPKTTPE